MRGVVWVIGVEAFQQLQHGVSMRADQFAKHRFDPLFVLVAELRRSRRDPERRGATVLGHPDAAVRERAMHEHTPQQAVLLEASVGVGKRPSPGGVVVEGEREELSDAVGLGFGYLPDADRGVACAFGFRHH